MTALTPYRGPDHELNRLAAQREQDLELKVRTLPCPSCDAKAGKMCQLGFRAHMSRYDAAVMAGLVPPLGVGKP